MSLRTWWQTRQRARASRFLQQHPALGLDVLRHDADLASTIALRAAAQDQDRLTTQWPLYSHYAPYAVSPSTHALPKLTPMNLRVFSESPPARRAINAMKHPLLDLPWSIEPVFDVWPWEEDKTPEITPAQRQHIQAATMLFRTPNDDESFRHLLELVVEDVIVGGYGAIELAATGAPRRPLVLYAVDGQSIRLNPHWDGTPTGIRYTQAMDSTGQGLGTAQTVELAAEELCYITLNPRTCTPFGLGYLEVAFQMITAFLTSFAYSQKLAANQTPQYAIFLGENIDPPTVRLWQQYWRQEVEGRAKVPILGGGRAPSVQPLGPVGDGPAQIAWHEFVLRMIAMAFGLSPQRLGLERDVNRSTAETMDVADWDSIAPLANTLEDAFTTTILWHVLGWTDIRFKWIVRDTDELRQAQISQLRYDMNEMTIDELREAYDKPPLPDGIGAQTKSYYEAAASQSAMPEIAPLPRVGGPPDPDEAEEDDEEEDALEAVDAFAPFTPVRVNGTAHP